MCNYTSPYIPLPGGEGLNQLNMFLLGVLKMIFLTADPDGYRDAKLLQSSQT
jgi:hypothetical protein